MGTAKAIAGSIFVLIGIYLFLSKGRETVNIIDTIGSNATKGIKVLQGR